MRMLEMDFFGAPAVCDLVHGNLDHFGCGFIDPGNAALVEPDMSIDCYRHTSCLHSIASARGIQWEKREKRTGSGGPEDAFFGLPKPNQKPFLPKFARILWTNRASLSECS